MQYQPAIRTSTPETLDGLQPGQWLDYDGSKGRFMGVRNGVSWIAWGGTARKRFPTFAAAFRDSGRKAASIADNLSDDDLDALSTGKF